MVKNSVNTAGQIIVEWFDRSQTEFGVLAPGQFSLHHTCTVHQSGSNTSDERRVGLALSYIPTRVRHVGSMRMPAMLVRGRDDYGHFDLIDPPTAERDEAALATHRLVGERYRDNYNAMVARHEAEFGTAAE